MSFFMLPAQLLGVSMNENFSGAYIAGAMWIGAAVLLSSFGGHR
jgi:hypothetical protein